MQGGCSRWVVYSHPENACHVQNNCMKCLQSTTQVTPVYQWCQIGPGNLVQSGNNAVYVWEYSWPDCWPPRFDSQSSIQQKSRLPRVHCLPWLGERVTQFWVITKQLKEDGFWIHFSSILAFVERRGVGNRGNFILFEAFL